MATKTKAPGTVKSRWLKSTAKRFAAMLKQPKKGVKAPAKGRKIKP